MNYRYENAKCIRVIDGDTIICDIDLGFHIVHRNIVFRLKGINAPEVRGTNKQKGIKSTAWLRDKILQKIITLETHKDKKGKYGRYLAIVYCDGANVNQEMVCKGLAKIYEKK